MAATANAQRPAPPNMAGRLSISENHAPAAMRWTPPAFFRAAAAAAGRTVRGAKRSSAEADGTGPAVAAAPAEPFPSIVELADDDDSDPFFALILVNQPLVSGFRHLWQRGASCLPIKSRHSSPSH